MIQAENLECIKCKQKAEFIRPTGLFIVASVCTWIKLYSDIHVLNKALSRKKEKYRINDEIGNSIIYASIYWWKIKTISKFSLHCDGYKSLYLVNRTWGISALWYYVTGNTPIINTADYLKNSFRKYLFSCSHKITEKSSRGPLTASFHTNNSSICLLAFLNPLQQSDH